METWPPKFATPPPPPPKPRCYVFRDGAVNDLHRAADVENAAARIAAIRPSIRNDRAVPYHERASVQNSARAYGCVVGNGAVLQEDIPSRLIDYSPGIMPATIISDYASKNV